MNNAEVLIKFKGDTKDAEESTKKVEKGLLTVKDLVKADLIGSAIKGAIKATGKLVSSITGIGTSVLKVAATGGMDRALNIEQAQFKLKGLGHDAQSVDAIMNDALNSVKGTAYGLDEAATIAASAVAAGVKPGQDLERTLKLVADAATISGRDLDSMGAIFNKVAASGKLTGQELNQLTDAGIPVLQLLADSLGKTTTEIKSMVSAGEIGFEEFQNAIEQGMGGAALTMGQTFNGALSNLKASLSRIGATVAQPLMDSVTPIMGTLTTVFDMIQSGNTDKLEETLNLLSTQISTAIPKVLNSFGDIANKAIPIISQLLSTIATTITNNLPMIINTLSSLTNSILTEIINLAPTLMPAIVGVITGIIKILAMNFPMIIQALITCFVELVNAISKELPTLMPIIVDAILNGILVLIDNIDVLIDCGIQLLMAVIDGIIQCLPILIEKMPVIIEKAITAINKQWPKLINAGWDILKKVADGLIKYIPQLNGKISQILNSMVNGFKTNLDMMKNVGKNIIEGIWNGIKNAKDWLFGKVSGFGKDMMKKVKDIFKIGSPSKLMAQEVGQWIPKGIAVGIDANTDSVTNAMKNLATDVGLNPQLTGSMQNSFSPNVQVYNNVNVEQDPLGQMVSSIKTFSGGAKNDYNYGSGI